MPVSKACCVKSKSSGKMTWRGSGKGSAKQSERSESSKKQHLPQAIHALIEQGLPEQQACGSSTNPVFAYGVVAYGVLTPLAAPLVASAYDLKDTVTRVLCKMLHVRDCRPLLRSLLP